MSDILNEDQRREQLIERALSLYEQQKDLEQELSPEELQELWSGLKHLATRGAAALGGAAKSVGNAVANKVNNAATAVGNAVYDNTIGAAKNAATAVKGAVGNAAVATKQAVHGVQDKVVDTYRQGEINGIVQRIHDLNNKYKELTGKSFVRQFGAAANAIPNSQKRAAAQPAPQQAAAQMAMAECRRMQKLAGLLTEGED